MVIHFKPKKDKVFKLKKIANLEKVTNIIFFNKRKMINKSIKKKILNKKKIEKISGLNLKARPTEINPENYYMIAKLIEIR